MKCAKVDTSSEAESAENNLLKKELEELKKEVNDLREIHTKSMDVEVILI